MFTRTVSKSAVSILGFLFVMSVLIGLSGSIALADDGDWDQCGNNEEFTTDFRLEDCRFKTRGVNPYFILKPGYRLELETPEEEGDRERSVETVLHDTKWIHLDGRRIKTRVLEERAFEWEEGEGDEEGEWKMIEISLNYFAICHKTNAVYYFGEFSRDCENGFTDDETMCEGEDGGPPTLPVTTGSWEAGVDTGEGVARPGIMMPGTPLLGAKYFQEIAPPDAVDRGEIVELGLDWPEPDELESAEAPDFTGCIKIFDTNPTPEGECGEEDAKIYCPGIGLVQDQELALVWAGFVDDDDDDGDDDDDDDGKWRRHR